MSGEELQIYRPDGQPFASYVEIAQRAEQAEQRAQQAEQKAQQAESQLEQQRQRTRATSRTFESNGH